MLASIAIAFVLGGKVKRRSSPIAARPAATATVAIPVNAGPPIKEERHNLGADTVDTADEAPSPMARVDRPRQLRERNGRIPAPSPSRLPVDEDATMPSTKP